ncbi:MAG: alcohol dehydrogenase catalytic domain-containing protein [Clostridiales bacterium]|nr:alcohol dehydrogenase catalytic domain-containing protein [Clostridiales bacterium]
MINRIAFLNNPGSFIFKDVKLSKLKNDYVRVRNLYCGICGSDYSCYIGRRNHYPLSLGHEGIAEVIESKNEHIGIGDYVITDFNYRCGLCYYCKHNLSHLCDKNDIGLFSNRMFALFSDIHYSYLTVISKPKSLILGTLAEPLSCCIHALENIPIETKSSILIFGVGNIGTLMAFYLKFYKKCSNIDVYDIIDEKVKNLCDNFKIGKYSLNKHYDIIIEATNTTEGFLSVLQNCKKGQKICSMSHLYGENTSQIYEYILKNELHISFPLRNGKKTNLKSASKIIDDYWIPTFDNLISTHPFNEINNAFKSKIDIHSNKQIIAIF